MLIEALFLAAKYFDEEVQGATGIMHIVQPKKEWNVAMRIEQSIRAELRLLTHRQSLEFDIPDVTRGDIMGYLPASAFLPGEAHVMVHKLAPSFGCSAWP